MSARDLSWLSLKLFLFESVDKFDGREEPHALAVVLDGLDAHGRGEVRLARAGAADQDDIVGVFQELAAMELTRSTSLTSLLEKSKPVRSR